MDFLKFIYRKYTAVFYKSNIPFPFPSFLCMYSSKLMCQFKWATGYPAIWSNIVLGVSVRVFLNEFNIYINRVIDCPP